MDKLLGKTVDNYKIIDIIGRGGMGIVYKAEDTKLDRIVVLKMIDPTLIPDESFLPRFFAEARLQARLESPHIVRVFAFLEKPAGMFIVMEFVDGKTLTDKIRVFGNIPVGEALDIFEKILTAIEVAHAAGIIHRDIKPRNVLISKQGEIKVTDFGLAKFLQGGEFTQTKMVAGTLNYMPPEQIEGLKNVDHRGDIYSLGMTLYEMLAGQVPFRKDATEYQVLRAIVEEPLPPPTSFNHNIPEALSEIVMKALAKDPADRYQSVTELHREIEQAGRLPRPAPPEPDEPTNIIPGNTETFGSPSTDFPGGRSNRGPSGAGILVPPRPPQERPGPPEPGPPPVFASKRWLIAIPAVIALVVIVYLLAIRPGSPPADLAVLTIETTPGGAAVYVDDRMIGETPLQSHALSAGTHRIRLVKDGFHNWRDDSLRLQAGVEHTIRETLMSEAVYGSLQIHSTPGGVPVRLNGRPIGNTPIVLDSLPPGKHVLKLEKQGYKTWTGPVNVPADRQETLNIELEKIAAKVVAQQTGTLVLDARPAGEIDIDGKRRSSLTGSPKKISVAAGSRKITFSHPQFGALSRTINVVAGQSHYLTCYFEARVNIQSLDETGEHRWGTIWVNDQSQDTSPRTITLPPGRHKIAVRRYGYESVPVDTTVIIKPAFREQEVRIVFHLKNGS